MKNQAFGRAIAMAAAIAAAMRLTDGMRQSALDAIGPYVSRGKGKGRHRSLA